MARMYSRKHGRHGSKRPPIKIVPKWLKISKKEVEDLVVKLAKEKYSSAVIGQILRDRYGIPDVKTITGKSITQIMRENNLYPEFPEDLMNLFKKAVRLKEHLSRHKKDKTSKKGFENLESKIRRLIKYYTREGKLPKNFVYDIEKIKLMLQKG
ncbi:MAG: 30S ribosomal protein S15 [Candidatus Aenigmatarchaeota archaeon]